MNTWAVLAAKEAVTVSGLGVGLVPVVGAGSVDGFAIGALISGTCILLLTSPRRGRRGMTAAVGGHALARTRRAVAMSTTTPADESGGTASPGQSPGETKPPAPERPDGSARDYQSRHRLSDQSQDRKRPESHRSAPRHAAPPASFSSRVTGRRAVRVLVGEARG
jgi:hypothetical protein